MINLILGQPGGGKSHEAVVYHVVPALNQGRKVITNLALDMDKFKAFGNVGRSKVLRCAS
ncbi:zonular occludens toxin domain-containing protein [Pseudomonas aeruginosa]|uniref:zonular occludens toxin domain-containing protein n=1 Tax=Pseudomonas aeruginosa TaxID=287 RepID=UPI00283A9D32|nr:zonular occludens toxin domain-containing protein [Pseudomonas aeruginosa]WMU33924.1 zonular occludens toxin domain-containing protein [Pseudomonas aeruginosa]